MIAHVAGLPLEEVVLPLIGGSGAGLLVARGWVTERVRRVSAAIGARWRRRRS
jgi:cytochrome oxidase assembly protein ShyY1